MGLDAESSDLTGRIQARRRALVLAGEVDPSLPGERMIHGRQPGAHDAFETAGAAQVIVQEARARRARASEAVVEMDYTDYRNGPTSEDADEPFEVGGGDDPENTWVPDEEEAARIEEAFEYGAGHVDGSSLELRIAGIEAAVEQLTALVEQQFAGAEERFDGLGNGFIALAKGLTEELAAIRAAVEPSDVESIPEPRGFWRRVWDFFSAASGPYE